MEADRRIPWVDPRDVGDIAAARLLAGWSGSSVEAVHGPADLSFAEVAEILAEVLGQPISLVPLTEEDLRAAGLSPAAAAGVIGMSGGGFVPEQARSFLTTTPSTVKGWAADHLGPVAHKP
jgi:uncharacterized protein YbjT (DUF2867 family)